MNNANYVFVYTQYTFQLCLFHFKEGIMKVLIIAIFHSIFKFVLKKSVVLSALINSILR